MPLVMQQHVFIFTYKYKMVRYHVLKRNLQSETAYTFMTRVFLIYIHHLIPLEFDF